MLRLIYRNIFLISFFLLLSNFVIASNEHEVIENNDNIELSEHQTANDDTIHEEHHTDTSPLFLL